MNKNKKRQPGSGRKKLPPGQGKSARIILRITADEKTHYEGMAERKGHKSMSAWIRATLNSTK